MCGVPQQTNNQNSGALISKDDYYKKQQQLAQQNMQAGYDPQYLLKTLGFGEVKAPTLGAVPNPPTISPDIVMNSAYAGNRKTGYGSLKINRNGGA